MTTAIEDQLLAPLEPQTGEEAPISFLRPVDMGLLATLDSRTHCRTPMLRVDPDELPLSQPVYVDGATVLPVGAGSSSASVETYRCACGFTIDVPAASVHALAS